MEAGFWHNKWATNDIKFHEGAQNGLMAKHFNKLSLKTGDRVFVPLCGKTQDIASLLEQGYKVAGAELNQSAIEQLFEDLRLEPTITTAGKLVHYSATDIDIFVGDIFELGAEALGHIDAIYDRAALVALPSEMRTRYTKHLRKITNTAPQFVICFEYDQSQLDGPPFSITPDELQAHYASHYTLTQVDRVDVPEGGVKGKCPAEEHAWALT